MRGAAGRAVGLDRRLLEEARRAWLALAAAVGLGLLGGIVVVGQAWLLSRAVSAVFLEGQALAGASAPLLGLLALAFLRAGLAWGGDLAADRVAGRVKAALRERLVAHLLALGPTYTAGERSGELTVTVVEGVEALDAYFRQYLPQLALTALLPAAVLLFVFPRDWISGLVLLLTAPLLPLFLILIGNLAEGLTRRQWASLSRMSAHFLDVLQGLTTLKLLGRSREQAQAIGQVSDQFRVATMGVLRVAFLSALVLEMVSTLGVAVVAVQVGLRLLYGHLAFEQAFFVLILAPEFYLPFRTLGARFHAGAAGSAAARRIDEVLGTERQEAGGEEGSVGDLAWREIFPLAFDDVHYAYDGGERPALRGASFEIGRGEVVALVGPSGAGKSTVANLLLRFVEPERGAVQAAGRPLASWPLAEWRAQVAWVPQRPHLFHGTVADNIRLARPEAADEEVERAARQAHAHEFIAALPQGYDTLLGEGGAGLSGGEAQRIALARAFLQDAPLLLLDEATAHLDPEVEDQIQEALARLLRGRTALIIAHRLGTVRRADRILVMDEGRVVESGSHAGLLARDGLYRRLVGAYGGGEGKRQAASSEQGEVLPGDRASIVNRQPSIVSRPQAQGPEPPPFPRKRAPTGLRLLRWLAPFAGRMALSVLLGVATVGSGIGLMTTSAYLIARAALRPSIADLQVAIVGVRFFGIARGLARYLERLVSHDLTFRLLARLRVWFYQALEPLAPARLLQYRSGDLLARIVADVEALQDLFLRAIAPPAVAAVVVALAGLLVGLFHGRLVLPLLSALLLAGVGLPLLVRALSRPTARRLVRTRAELNARLVDGIQGVADLLACGAEGRYLAGIRRLGAEWAGLQGRMAALSGLHGAATGLLMNLGTWAVLVVGIRLVNAGELEGVYLGLLALAAISSFEAVLPLAPAFQTLETSLEAGRRLYEIVDAEPAVRDPVPSVLPTPDVPAALPVGPLALRVSGLRFAYGPGMPPALKGIGFSLPSGGRLAVVGPSGAGKTTLLQVLLRLWDYSEGEILAFGRDLREIPQEAWRRRVAVVSQATHLFNATVRDNLLLARPGATEVEMVAAARRAQIHEFVQSLPQGYDTWIGEQGLRLSAGQRQRLAVARALLRDAPLLFLDEPTANLDALTEREVLAALLDLMEGRTVLLATHRLAGLEGMDVLVLREGRVVEAGRHEELLRAGGLYARMWRLQTGVLAS